jgi:hypothetical protein
MATNPIATLIASWCAGGRRRLVAMRERMGAMRVRIEPTFARLSALSRMEIAGSKLAPWEACGRRARREGDPPVLVVSSWR